MRCSGWIKPNLPDRIKKGSFKLEAAAWTRSIRSLMYRWIAGMGSGSCRFKREQ
jgi:hypothetical protein